MRAPSAFPGAIALTSMVPWDVVHGEFAGTGVKEGGLKARPL